MLHQALPFRILMAALCLSIAAPLFASTYYLSPNGSDTDSGTAAQPWKTLTRAFQQGGGHTYVLQNGTYDYTGMDINAPPSGTAAAYTVIKAETDGAALIRRPIHIDAPGTSYIRFEGLRWKANLDKQIIGHHLKFFRCTFEDGPMTASNVKNTNVGRIEDDPGVTSDILLEDCLFFGHGGRYELLVYNARRVVVRRAVIRHDGGWPGNASDPEAGITFYNSSYCVAQNVIVLDSLAEYYSWIAAFLAIHNPNVETLATSNLTYKGCIALATKGSGLSAEGQGVISDITIEDSVFWDNLGAGIVFNTKDKPNTRVTNATIGNSRYTGTGRGIAYYSGTTPITVKNVIVTAKNEAFQAVSPTYYDCWNTGTCSGSATGRQTYNPFTNGLLYLHRIEPGSNLAQHGEGGGRIGANVTTRIGVSGTYYGETGWNADTGEPLWPWPNEARARAEMCASTSTGFCASPSLTDYVCAYLGNSCGSADTQPPTVPANVLATPESSSRIRLDWSASTDNVGVSGYRVDVSTSAAFATFVSGYQNRDAGNVTTFAITGLSASTTYYARVRAYDAAANTSASSNPASATTPSSGGSTRVIAVGDLWRYLKGTAAPPAQWNGATFNDSAWLSGPTGIGYGDGDDATVLSDMQNSYWSVYARRAFTLGNPAGVTALSLVVDWDDGFVAYLNGVEVARSNMPAGAPMYTTPAVPFHEVGAPQTFDLTPYASALVAGVNVLAIEIHNDTVTSSDLSLLPNLDITASGDIWSPSTPQNVAAAAVSSSEIAVSWSASSDDTGVTGYRIDVSTSPSFASFVSGYQDRDTGNVTTMNVIGLSASTTYSVRVRAYDTAGNRSLDSASASATTSAASTSTTVRAIAVGDTWKYFKGTSAPPASWNAIAFDDAAWLSGPTGIGYGDNDDATVLSDMQNSYISVFARKTFTVATTASVAGLTLIIDWDDGYVAYLNGTEVARANMAGTAYNAVATTFHEAGTPVVVDLSAFRNLLVAGTNVLAIQIHNDDVASSDLSLRPALDLRIPEVVVRVGDVWKYAKGTAAPPPSWNAVAFNDSAWASGPTGIGYGDGDDATVLSDMQNSYASVYARRAFTIADASAVTRLSLTIDFDDGYVAYVNGTEVARSNMPAGTPSHTTLATPFHEAGTPVTIDLPANVLVTGTNVLAIEIHNDDVASSDLSLIPALSVER
jgi:hypothetical protein